MLLDIMTFAGRLHPLVVHLPIGFLIMGLILDLLSYIPKYRLLKEAVSVTLLAGFIAAALACILGYVLSLTGDYDAIILRNHKLAGIALAFVSGILWLTTTSLYTPYVVIPRSIVTGLCVGAVLLMGYTGHQGGSLTHGSDFLSLETLTHRERIKPAKAEEAMIFEDVVHPALMRRCEGCHRTGKRKGQLILSTYGQLMKGGKNGVVVVAGKPGESELYRRITLDPGHEDFMPTDGKTPLTKAETEVIRWWIEKAEAAKETKITLVTDHESMLPLVAGLLGLPGGSISVETGFTDVRPVNPLIPLTADMAVVDNLRRKGLEVRVMLHSPVMLDITLPAQSGIDIREIDSDLSAVAKNIVWLNLSHNNLTEEALPVLKQMTNLEKLRLEKNPVGDGIADVVLELKYLDALNLNETKLSAHGLSKLKEHSSLKRIYTWKTMADR